MICPVKRNLIEKERALERINEKMLDARRAYLKTRAGKNSLFILDKVVVAYLEQVRRIKLEHLDTPEKTLSEYCRKNGCSITQFTREILSRKEQSDIVIRGLSRYTKNVGYYAQGVMSLKIEDLTVIDMSIWRRDNE